MQRFLNLGIPWPIGARLRFKQDACVKQQYEYLRGTPVLILGPLTWFENGGWRQRVAAFGARRVEDQIGFALPEQLEPIPGEDPEALRDEEAIEDCRSVSHHVGAIVEESCHHGAGNWGPVAHCPEQGRDRPIRPYRESRE